MHATASPFSAGEVLSTTRRDQAILAPLSTVQPTSHHMEHCKQITRRSLTGIYMSI